MKIKKRLVKLLDIKINICLYPKNKFFDCIFIFLYIYIKISFNNIEIKV